METATRNLDIVTRIKGTEEVKRGFEDMDRSAEKLVDSTKDIGTSVVDTSGSLKNLNNIQGDFIEKTVEASSTVNFYTVGLSLLRTNFLGISASLMATGGVIYAIVDLVKWFNTLKLTQDDVNLSSASLRLEILNTKTAGEEYVSVLGKINKELREMTNEQLTQRKIALETSTTKYGLQFHGTSFMKGDSDEAKRYKAEVELLNEINRLIKDRDVPNINNEANAYERLLRQQEGLTLILHQTIAGTKEQIKAKKDLADVEKLLDTYSPNKKIKAIKDITESEKDRARWLTALNDAYNEFYSNEYKYGEKIASTLNNMGSGKGMTFGSGGQLGSLLGRGVNTNQLKADFTEGQKLYAELFRDAADVMRSEFGSAWESIFGDANSLFEKLIASWASTLFTKLGNSFGGAILDLLPGGGAIADLLGLSKAVNIGNNYATKLRLE